MKPFHLDSHMVTLRGVFYPTGHIVLMLPGREHADQAAQALMEAGVAGDEVSMLTPETLMGPIARTIGSGDMPLPSPGTEGEAVRHLVELASEGHWGLLVHAPRARDAERVMKAVQGLPVAFAERYRHLVIEDL